MDWYYAVGKEQKGPVDETTFKNLCNSGTIAAQTLVWNKTMTDWQAFEKIAPNQTITDSPAAPAEQSTVSTGKKLCSECGKAFGDDELVAYQDSLICAGCKPIFLQKIREGVSTGQMIYAGFWIRFAAKMVDGLIMGVVNILIGLAFNTIFPPDINNAQDFQAVMMPAIISGLLQMCFYVFYMVWFVGKHAATPGKMLCGLKIVTPQNERVSYLRALGRTFAEILSGIIFYIGYIMAGFDEEKRSLHDRICSTRVIKK